MHQGTFSPTVLLIVLLVIVAYFLFLGLAYRKKLAHVIGMYTDRADHNHKIMAAAQMEAVGHVDLMPPLVDYPHSGIHVYEEDPEEFEPLDNYDAILDAMDEEENALLIDAERLVEKIQVVVNNIASYPINREEVTTKISALVSEYAIFMQTEYFDAINSFIAVTVQRDLQIDFTKEDIIALWQSDID